MTPDAHTNAEHTLEVGNGHALYIQDWGNKKAKQPIFFLHGGPGDGTKEKHKLPFDPKSQRVIFHDQRGSGRSTPIGKWHHNNTQELAADITKIADFLGIDKFILTGDSWGSTLALYYAIQAPKRVKALLVSAIWTCSEREAAWEREGLFQSHFPDKWEEYLEATPKEFRADPNGYHFARILGDNEEAAQHSALVYAKLVISIMSLDDHVLPIDPATFDRNSISTNVRYMTKNCFMSKDFILKNAHKLKMPVYILHGRYDLLCIPETAYRLHKAVPQSSLTWIVSGHRGEHETITTKRLLFSQLTKEK